MQRKITPAPFDQLFQPHRKFKLLKFYYNRFNIRLIEVIPSQITHHTTNQTSAPTTNIPFTESITFLISQDSLRIRANTFNL